MLAAGVLAAAPLIGMAAPPTALGALPPTLEVIVGRDDYTGRYRDRDRQLEVFRFAGDAPCPPPGAEVAGQPAPELEPDRRWEPSLDDAWLQEPHPSGPEPLFYLSEASVK